MYGLIKIQKKMTIGKNGIKNLAFASDETFDKYGSIRSIKSIKSIKEIKEIEDNVLAKNVSLDCPAEDRRESELFIDKKLTTKGHILILALASTIFACEFNGSIL